MLGSKYRVLLQDVLKYSKKIYFVLGQPWVLLLNTVCEIVKITISWNAVNNSSDSLKSPEIFDF